MGRITVAHQDIRDLTDLGNITTQICDPPYSPRVHGKAVSTRTDGAGPRKRDLGFDCLDPETRTVICQIAASIPGYSVIFSDLESVGAWADALESHGAHYIRTVIWVRWSQPQITGDRPGSGSEAVIVAHSDADIADAVILAHGFGPTTWNGPGGLTHFDEKSLRGADKYSCEKPLDLMLRLVMYFSNPGDVIIDGTCGAGTTGRAVQILGNRDVVLYDASHEAVIRTETRLGSPLSKRERERVERAYDIQSGWLHREPTPNSVKGAQRHHNAYADLTALGGHL